MSKNYAVAWIFQNKLHLEFVRGEETELEAVQACLGKDIFTPTEPHNFMTPTGIRVIVKEVS